MSNKEIPQLASEICTLAHRGWEHLPNTEVLFRAIGERAQKISELAVVSDKETAPEDRCHKCGLVERAIIHNPTLRSEGSDYYHQFLSRTAVAVECRALAAPEEKKR